MEAANEQVEFELKMPCPFCESDDAGRPVDQRCEANHFVAKMFRDESGQLMLKVGCQTHSVARWLEVAECEGEDACGDLAAELRDFRQMKEFPAAIALVKQKATLFAPPVVAN